MVTSKEEIYDAINRERSYQERLGKTDGSTKTIGDYLVMMDTYFRRAKDGWTDNAGVLHSLTQIRKIAAIAVRCMEEHGIVSREQEGMMLVSEQIKQNEEMIKKISSG